jgi:hypothetical protein
MDTQVHVLEFFDAVVNDTHADSIRDFDNRDAAMQKPLPNPSDGGVALLHVMTRHSTVYGLSRRTLHAQHRGRLSRDCVDIRHHESRQHCAPAEGRNDSAREVRTDH